MSTATHGKVGRPSRADKAVNDALAVLAKGREDKGGTPRETKTGKVAEYIVEQLRGGPIPSSKIHEMVKKEFDVSSLYGAREALGDSVETGVRVEVDGKSQSCWRLRGTE